MVSYDEAYEACIQHYIGVGVPEEMARDTMPTREAEVFRIYNEIQKGEEQKKHIGICPVFQCGCLNVMETYLLDEEPSPASEE